VVETARKTLSPPMRATIETLAAGKMEGGRRALVELVCGAICVRTREVIV
jgi:hypothetical protein